MKPTEVDVLTVLRNGRRIGSLRRTEKGAAFDYDEAIAEDDHASALSWATPPSRRRIAVDGVNLPPFFAGLLPEGLRLSALVRRIKTSEDDLFSLLAEVGADCIGDIAVIPEGADLKEPTPSFDLTTPEQLDFDELLATCLREQGRERGVAGVQQKISGAMISLPLRSKGAQESYLLKLNPKDQPLLIENEAFFMEMAESCGLAVEKRRLVHDRNGQSGLLVQRFDRHFQKGTKSIERIHQEDGCQILDRYPADKYRISLRELAEAITRIASAPMVQVLRLLELQAFNFLIGNGDFHAKNLSLYRSPKSYLVELTPAYDLLSTLPEPHSDHSMPLKMNGKDDRLTTEDFVAFAARFQIRKAAVVAMIDRLLQRVTPWLDSLNRVPWPAETRDLVARGITARLQSLSRP